MACLVHANFEGVCCRLCPEFDSNKPSQMSYLVDMAFNAMRSHETCIVSYPTKYAPLPITYGIPAQISILREDSPAGQDRPLGKFETFNRTTNGPILNQMG